MTYRTILLFLQCRHATRALAVLGSGSLILPILGQQLVDHDRDGMRADIHPPLQLRNSIVSKDLAQMASRLHRVPSDGASGRNAVARTHRDRICGVIDVDDVLQGERQREMQA